MASSSSRWRTVIGKNIEGAEVYWSWCEEADKPETRVHYQQDLHVRYFWKLKHCDFSVRNLEIWWVQGNDGPPNYN